MEKLHPILFILFLIGWFFLSIKPTCNSISDNEDDSDGWKRKWKRDFLFKNIKRR